MDCTVADATYTVSRQYMQSSYLLSIELHDCTYSLNSSDNNKVTLQSPLIQIYCINVSMYIFFLCIINVFAV